MKDAVTNIILIVLGIVVALVALSSIIYVLRATSTASNNISKRNLVTAQLVEGRDLVAYDSRVIYPQDVVSLFAKQKGSLPIQFNGEYFDKARCAEISENFFDSDNLMHLGKLDTDGDQLYTDYYMDEDDCLDYDKLYYSKIVRGDMSRFDVIGFVIAECEVDEDGNITGKAADEAYMDWKG